MSIKIIGINHDMFISSAALIVDGKIKCAIPEERLSREKMSRSFPLSEKYTLLLCFL